MGRTRARIRLRMLRFQFPCPERLLHSRRPQSSLAFSMMAASFPAEGFVPALDDVFPAPLFEGSEKRVELDFDMGPGADPRGLRALPRSEVDALMDLAACTVVSVRSCAAFDAYVLSESSLFIYADKFVLKTCGTTRLLSAAAPAAAAAEALGLRLRRVRYSRASFLFPEQQPALYQDWDAEVAFLTARFESLGDGPRSYVLGDARRGLQWHVFVADRERSPSPASRRPGYSLEVCMTELGRAQADGFRRIFPGESAKECTERTGVRALFPHADIDDYVFDPCGYSMNGLWKDGFCTIHVTPEPQASYASCEASNWDPADLDVAGMVAGCAGVFLPGSLFVTLTTDADGADAWEALPLTFPAPPGYRPDGVSLQTLGCGGRVAYLRFALEDPSALAGSCPAAPRGIERLIRDTNLGVPAPTEVPSRDTATPVYLPGETRMQGWARRRCCLIHMLSCLTSP